DRTVAPPRLPDRPHLAGSQPVVSPACRPRTAGLRRIARATPRQPTPCRTSDTWANAGSREARQDHRGTRSDTEGPRESVMHWMSTSPPTPQRRVTNAELLRRTVGRPADAAIVRVRERRRVPQETAPPQSSAREQGHLRTAVRPL